MPARLPLWMRFAAVSLAVASPALLMSAYSLWHGKKQTERLVNQAVYHQAESAASRLDAALDSAVSLLMAALADQPEQDASVTDCSTSTQAALAANELLVGIAVLQDKQLLCSSFIAPPVDWHRADVWEWAADARARERALLLRLPPGVSGTPRLFLVRQVAEPGSAPKIALGELALSELSRQIAVRLDGAKPTAVLVDSAWNVWTTNSDGTVPTTSGMLAPYEQLTVPPYSAKAVAVPTDGLRLYAAAKLESYPLKVVVWATAAEAYRTAHGWPLRDLVPWLVAALASVLVGVLVCYHFSRPVRSLCRTARKLAEGDDTVRADETLPNGFGDAARRLNSWMDSRRASREKLHATTLQLQRMADFFAAQSQANREVVKQVPPAELFDSVCRIICQRAHAHMCWIGTWKDSKMRLEAAHGQRAQEYVSRLLPDYTETGVEGPTLLALRTGKAQIVNDVSSDPSLQAWAAVVHDFGIGALAVFPLQLRGRTVGVLHISMRESHVFDDALVGLLTSLAEDVSFSLDSHDRLQAANRARHAEAANRAKTAFMSQISHELRTPLNAVLGFSQLLAQSTSNRLTAEEREQLTQVLQSGNQLRALIDDLLDISRIEAGQLSLQVQPVELRPLLQEVCQMSHPHARQREVHIALCPPPSLTLRTDPIRLRQVLANLLSNAIKYNRVDGRVRVSAFMEAPWGCVRIEDSGLGMSAEQQQQLFQPFNRLGRERSGISGTGIGLALTRKLVAMLGGELSIESAPGIGTSATVKLPLAAAPNAAETSPPLGALASAPSPSSIQYARRALYIEDNPVNVTLVRHMLRRWPNVELIAAEDGRTGLEKATELQPDVILLDRNLPDMDGLEVLATLRQSARFSATPILVVSASAMPEEVEQARAHGATDYWTKPMDVDHCIAVLDELLGQSKRI